MRNDGTRLFGPPARLPGGEGARGSTGLYARGSRGPRKLWRLPTAVTFMAGVTILSAACGDPAGGSSPTARDSVRPGSLTDLTVGTVVAAPPGAGQWTAKTARPEYRTRLTFVETTGKAQFNEETLVRIHAPLTGRVVEVLARPGDVVEPGTPLFTLDSPDLGSAKSDYAKAVADAERSAAALRLARELFEVRAVAEKEVREAATDARKAEVERERSATRLGALGVTPDQLKDIAARADAVPTMLVTAPRSGVVVERNVSPGQVVAYGQSDTPVNLFVIADLRTMWVIADVYEPDVPKISRGAPVTVTPPCCPTRRYQGTVSYISDTVDKDTRTLKVRAVVPNRDRQLKAEMFLKVAIETGASQVLSVPENAVHRIDDETFVLVASRENEYVRRPVTIGPALGGWVEIVRGVTPDVRVVTNGSILLKQAHP